MTHFHNGDRIVYVVVSNLNGADHAASFDKVEAQRIAVGSEHFEVQPRVVDVSQLRKDVLGRLNPIERLVMDKVESGKRRDIPPTQRS